nr:uncharacterized protein LOC105866212 isoform X3 [Microcebus murinus]
MAQRPLSDLQGTQPGFLTAATNTSHAKTQDPPPTTYNPGVSTPNSPPAIHSRRVSIQDPPPDISSRRVSIQDPPPAVSGRRVSIQDPPPAVSGRRVSIQDPPPAVSGRRVSIQDPPPAVSSRRVSIQDPLPSVSGRRVSIQDPSPDFSSRRVSIQDPLPAVSGRRVSIQDPPPDFSIRRVSIQDPLPVVSGRRVSIQDPPPAMSSSRVSTQEIPSITHCHHFLIRDVSQISQPRRISIQSSDSGASIKSVTHSSHDHMQKCPLTTKTPHLSIQSHRTQSRGTIDIPPSITISPEPSIESMESIIWQSQESLQEDVLSSQLKPTSLDNIESISSCSTIGTSSLQLQSKCRRHSLLPVGWQLLHEAKKISRHLSLVLSLAGIVVIGLVTLSQPWVHFQVPLRPPGDPAGSPTILINTVFFVRCPDSSCRHEYDQNAYLLDLAWAFLLFSSIASFCLSMALMSTIFFANLNQHLLDFFTFITSTLAGTSITLGILFYLLQAQMYLQEGMTYKLGLSFYLAWTGVFLFLMIGFLSYLNHKNFWSILAIQAIWS